MSSITNCEFMVKGYHYTEPTNPIRTDSCRLYLDTSIDGEESDINIGDYSWIKYYIKATIKENTTALFEGYLPDEFWTSSSYIYPKDLNGNITTTAYFCIFSGNTLTSLNVGTLVSSGGRVWSEIEITGAGTYSYTDPDFGTIYNFTLTEVEYGDLLRLPETVILTPANSQEIIEELIPDQDNLIWNLTLSLDSDSSHIAYLYNQQWSAGVSLQQNYSGETEGGSWNYTAATREFILTYNQWEESYRVPYVRYYIVNDYLTHLKGIHGFYFQTE